MAFSIDVCNKMKYYKYMYEDAVKAVTRYSEQSVAIVKAIMEEMGINDVVVSDENGIKGRLVVRQMDKVNQPYDIIFRHDCGAYQLAINPNDIYGVVQVLKTFKGRC